MDLIRIAARIAAGEPEMKTIEFEMPGDQDWDPGIWERLGVGQEWERLGKAFYNAGATVDDSEEITVEFEAKDEAKVRAVIDAARAGSFGADVQAYWTAAEESAPDGDPGSAMESVQMEIRHPAGMTAEEAVERAKKLVPCATGSWEPVDDGGVPNAMLGLLECEPGFYDRADKWETYGPDDAGVVVEWEKP